jgi:hypothetical protein
MGSLLNFSNFNWSLFVRKLWISCILIAFFLVKIRNKGPVFKCKSIHHFSNLNWSQLFSMMNTHTQLLVINLLPPCSCCLSVIPWHHYTSTILTWERSPSLQSYCQAMAGGRQWLRWMEVNGEECLAVKMPTTMWLMFLTTRKQWKRSESSSGQRRSQRQTDQSAYARQNKYKIL